MSGVNKAIIVGRLGQNPEYKEFDNGGGMTTFSVATSENWTDKSGEKQERTAWHNIKVFGNLAGVCHKYLTKGKQVYIEGRIQYDSYEKDGETKYFTNIVPNSVQFLDSANTDNTNAAGLQNHAPQTAAEASANIDGF